MSKFKNWLKMMEENKLWTVCMFLVGVVLILLSVYVAVTTEHQAFALAFLGVGAAMAFNSTQAFLKRRGIEEINNNDD